VPPPAKAAALPPGNAVSSFDEVYRSRRFDFAMISLMMIHCQLISRDAAFSTLKIITALIAEAAVSGWAHYTSQFEMTEYICHIIVLIEAAHWSHDGAAWMSQANAISHVITGFPCAEPTYRRRRNSNFSP